MDPEQIGAGQFDDHVIPQALEARDLPRPARTDPREAEKASVSLRPRRSCAARPRGEMHHQHPDEDLLSSGGVPPGTPASSERRGSAGDRLPQVVVDRRVRGHNARQAQLLCQLDDGDDVSSADLDEREPDTQSCATSRQDRAQVVDRLQVTQAQVFVERR